MKIYVVVKCEYINGAVAEFEVIDSYSDEIDAKVFCDFENKKLNTETVEYLYQASELY